MTSLDDRLDVAIDRLIAGQAPGEEPDLQPLLAAASALTALRPPAAAGESRARLRAALRSERERRTGAGQTHGHGPFTRIPGKWWAVAAATLAVAAVVLLATRALPGQPQYALKRSLEALPFLLEHQPDELTHYYTRLADRSLDEVERLLASSQPVPGTLLDDVRRSWEMAAAAGGNRNILLLAAERQSQRIRQFLPLLTGQAQAAAVRALEAIRLATVVAASPTPPEAAPALATPAPPTLSPTTAPGPAERAQTKATTPSPEPVRAPDTTKHAASPTAVMGPAGAAETPIQTPQTPAPSAGSSTPAPVATPTLEPTETAGTDETPEPTRAPGPRPTATVRPEATPVPTATQKPTDTPRPPATASPTLHPTATQEAAETEVPTPTRAPTLTHQPSPTTAPTATRAPTSTRQPNPTSAPTATKEPSPTKVPSPTRETSSTPEPTQAAEPTHTPEAGETPDSRTRH